MGRWWQWRRGKRQEDDGDRKEGAVKEGIRFAELLFRAVIENPAPPPVRNSFSIALLLRRVPAERDAQYNKNPPDTLYTFYRAAV
jgi:hypothetical protein